MGLFRKKPTVPQTEIKVHSEVVSGGDYAGLSQEILDTLKEHGIEPGQNRVVDASEIPGLTEEIMGALNQAGVWDKAFTGMAELGELGKDDPVEQLEKLAQLHKKGVLTDYEFAVAKQKLLDENWQDS